MRRSDLVHAAALESSCSTNRKNRGVACPRRSLRVCPERSCWIAELSQHKPDRGETQECEGAAIEIFPILGQAPASSKPCEGALDDPSFWQDNEALRVIGSLDDFDIHLRHYFRHGAAKQWALIAAIGVELQQEWIQAEQRRHDEFATVAILNVGGVHDGVDQQALRVDENMALLALDLFSRIVARRIDRKPPFSALFTLWLSMTAAVGLASRPSASRHFT